MIDIIQKRYQGDSWRIVICCILLNQTTNVQVRPVIEKFFEKFPNPKRTLESNESEISSIIAGTGLQNQKAKRILKFSSCWYSGERDRDKLPGVGPYAKETLRIFVDGDLNFIPNDKKLKIYVSESLSSIL